MRNDREDDICSADEDRQHILLLIVHGLASWLI